jgi:hypothetical protein
MLRLYVKSIFLHNIMVTVIHVSPVNRKDFQLKEYMSAKITVCLTTGSAEQKSLLLIFKIVQTDGIALYSRVESWRSIRMILSPAPLIKPDAGELPNSQGRT